MPFPTNNILPSVSKYVCFMSWKQPFFLILPWSQCVSCFLLHFYIELTVLTHHLTGSTVSVASYWVEVKRSKCVMLSLDLAPSSLGEESTPAYFCYLTPRAMDLSLVGFYDSFYLFRPVIDARHSLYVKWVQMVPAHVWNSYISTTLLKMSFITQLWEIYCFLTNSFQ